MQTVVQENTLMRTTVSITGIFAVMFGIVSAGFAQTRQTKPTTAKQHTQLEAIQQILDHLATERSQIEQAVPRTVSKEQNAQTLRADLLVRYGRSSAASGRFDLSAAAYAMFLNEFGTEHPYSKQIVIRLADSLAPLDLDSVSIVHTEKGPQYRPTWRMGKEATPERLRHAVLAYELAAELSSDKTAMGNALLKLGWVHRALNDWDASTEAWMRCAREAQQTKPGADALLLAAENLTWTNQPHAAAVQLRLFAGKYPGDSRAKSGIKRALLLEIETRRSDEWLRDPVASLRAEMEAHADQLTPQEMYRSAVQWLKQKKCFPAIVAVGRWGCSQADWSVEQRISAHYDVVDALLGQPQAGEAERLAAVDTLDAIVALSPSDDWAVPAALRCSRVLSELGRFETADAKLDRIEARVGDSLRWRPRVMLERIQSLLDRGDREGAKALLAEFAKTYPDDRTSAQYRSLWAETQQEKEEDK